MHLTTASRNLTSACRRPASVAARLTPRSLHIPSLVRDLPSASRRLHTSAPRRPMAKVPVTSSDARQHILNGRPPSRSRRRTSRAAALPRTVHEFTSSRDRPPLDRRHTPVSHASSTPFHTYFRRFLQVPVVTGRSFMSQALEDGRVTGPLSCSKRLRLLTARPMSALSGTARRYGCLGCQRRTCRK
jgi:hypothetical protein